METPKVKVSKFIKINVNGYLTKMAVMPIYSKSPLNIFFSRTKRPMALGLGMYYWRYWPYQVCTNDGSGLSLTFFNSRPNLIPNAFILEKS